MWKQEAKKLFEGWDASLLHAYFNGSRGSMLADDEKAVAAALIDIGDFCFLTGVPSECLLKKVKGFKLLVPRDARWETLIELFYGSQAKKFTRYAIKKEPDAFDQAKLSAYASALDAHDLRSLALAEKLGYRLDYPYTAYEITGEKLS